MVAVVEAVGASDSKNRGLSLRLMAVRWLGWQLHCLISWLFSLCTGDGGDAGVVESQDAGRVGDVGDTLDLNQLEAVGSR